MDIAAKEDMTISSVDGEVTINAKNGIELLSGGSYVKISDAGIELGTPKNVLVKSVAFQKMGPNSISVENIKLNIFNKQERYTGKIKFIDDDGIPYQYTKYTVYKEDGSKQEGITDNEGWTEIFMMQDDKEKIKVNLHLNQGGKNA